ncbi:hypothetical protein [Microbacterium sp.]|uniref:hypothetical protein n=1 Tax=Microbacterium sp. TaxID=51671 RepID=UPI003C717B63
MDDPIDDSEAMRASCDLTSGTEAKAVLLQRFRVSSPQLELSPVEAFGFSTPTRPDAPTLF